MRKYLFFFAFIFAFASINAQTVVWSDNFDDQDISDWSVYDEDGDGFEWDAIQLTDTGGNPVGTPILTSVSWAGFPLTPDNWAVSPAIDLTGATGDVTLKWYVFASDPDWNLENYSVYVGTSNTVADLTAGGALFTEDVLPATLTERTLDLSSFAGETVYVAFRHYDSTDQFRIGIDDVSVEAEDGGGTGGGSCDLSGELADPALGGPVWDRPLADGSGMSSVGLGVSYHVYGPFTVSVDGDYEFHSTQTGWDGMIFVYQNAFDPMDALTNYLAGNDDDPDAGIGESAVTASLVTGTEYYFITTAFASDDFGPFTNTITGPGDVTCDGGSTGGGEDCDQGDDSNGFENGFQIGTGTDYENADDFYVSADNTLHVMTIELNALALEPIESIGFTFYNDEAGAPGSTVVDAVTGLVPYDQVLVGSAFGYNVYSIYVDVDLEFAGGATGTSYWMQPLAAAPGGAIGGVFWEISSAGTLGAPIHTSELDGPWTADVDGSDGVFKLHCEHVDPPTPPCTFGIAVDIEPITRVMMSDIDNSSDATVNGSPALEDFTAVEGHVAAGESYDVALEGNTAGDFTTYFTIFVDWNQDGDLTDDGEMYEIGSITSSTGTDGQQATGSVMVPADAMAGPTLMRVIKNYNVSPTNPCGTYNYGQAEDYTLVIGDGPVGGDCEQMFTGDPNTGVGFINNGADVYVAANDINVAANTQFNLEKITLDVVTLGGEPTTFDVSFYTDDSGVDEQIGTTLTGVTPSSITPNGTFGSTGYPVYTVELTLSSPQLLQATATEAAKYWVGLSGAPSVEAANVYWVSYLYTDNADSEPSWQSPDGGFSWAEFANTNGEAVEGIMKVEGVCETLGLSDMTSFDFAYYPNPVKDVLNISSKKPVESVMAFNLAGQQVLSTAKVSSGQVNVSTLPSGAYVFRVTLQGGQIETFKIIKK